MSRKDINYHDDSDIFNLSKENVKYGVDVGDIPHDEIDCSKLDSSKVGPIEVEVFGITGTKSTINLGKIIELGMGIQNKIDDLLESIDELNDCGNNNKVSINILKSTLNEYRKDFSALSDIRVPYDDKISRIIQKHM